MTERTSGPTDARNAIKAAYATLRNEGYFCRMSFTCCVGCARAAIPEFRRGRYVFFTKQDDAMLAQEGACYLCWRGDAAEIAMAMRGAGLVVEWNGSDTARISGPASLRELRLAAHL